MPLPLFSITLITSGASPVGPTYPTGITFYPLSFPFYTSFVKGTSEIYSLSIGNSYLPNGQYFDKDNASLQLNAMIDGVYWAQNVALFHEINSTKFEVTMIVNLWNLTGPFTVLKNNVTTYDNLGVFCYQGPTFNVTLPETITLFMNTSKGLEFGYTLNGTSQIYLRLPYNFGNFELGGISLSGLPNDLELIWGGPGGGSVVYMSGSMRQELYYLNGNSLVIPSDAISVGLDTAESAYGIVSYGNITNILYPFDVLMNGFNNPSVLWPIPPSIKIQTNGTVKEVNLSISGRGLNYQKVEILVPSFNLSSPIPFTSVIATNYTINGIARFSIPNQSVYIAYFPGNFSLAQTYTVSSPTLSKIASGITTFYNKLVTFLKTYNFKKALISNFNKIKYTSTGVSINYILLEYIAAFAIGVIISAIFIKYKV